MSKLLNPPRGTKNMPQSDTLIKEVIVTLTLDKVIPNEEQPRKDFSNLDELVSSIRRNGQQIPIIVVSLGEEKYKIIDGERRFRALKKLAEEKHKELSQETVRAICRQDPIDDTAIFIMNLIRNSYSPMEIALWIGKYKNEKKLINEKIAEEIGKSPTNVTEYLSLLKLPEYIQKEELGKGTVPFNKLKQLATKSGGMSEDEKILEYKKLRQEYSEDTDKTNNNDNAAEIRTEKAIEAIGLEAKKFSAITKKLDVTIKSISRFNIEKIPSLEDRKVFAEKLDAIIAEAQEKKAKLERLS